MPLYVHVLSHVYTSFEPESRCTSQHARWSTFLCRAAYRRNLRDVLDIQRLADKRLLGDLQLI